MNLRAGAGTLTLAGLVVVLALALAGCSVSVSSIRLGQPGPARPATSEVRAYSVKTPECPFEEITILTAYRENDLGIAVSAAKTLEALKRRTRELGGDALLGLTTVPRGENVRTGGLRGTAVRFTDPSCNMDEPATPEP